MGIFDFFKRKAHSSEKVEEKIGFKEVSSWIEEKKNKIKQEQKEPLNEIKGNLSKLVNSLEERVEVLENLSLEDKKAPERAMSIVKENFDKFVYELEKLIINLKEIESNSKAYDSLEALISKINFVFEDFEKKSIMSYKKSTFLIGDELGVVTQDITKFFKLFNKIIKENDPFIKQNKTIFMIGNKLKEIDTLDITKEENKKLIEKANEKINNHNKKIEELKKQLDEKKKTQEYIEQIKIKNNLESNKTKLLIEFQALKELIDFKALAKVYHTIERKMSLIKEYNEEFVESFKKYGEENLRDLIDIKEINKKAVEEKINVINVIKKNIEEVKNKIIEDITLKLEKEIDQINNKIYEQNSEKTKLEKVLNNLSEDTGKIKQDIIKELEGIGVIVKN